MSEGIEMKSARPTDSNFRRTYICEMIIKISNSDDHDKLDQLEMIKDYAVGMYDLAKKKAQ